MATRDFLPRRDADLLAWANSFSTLLTATPTAFGCTAAQATAFSGLLATFAADLATASSPPTRTRAAVEAKNASRKLLKSEARELGRVINAFPAITNEQRIELGLTPRSGTIVPINPPTECPVLTVEQAAGRILKIRLSGQDTTRRGKPDGVQGATLMTFVGDEPPADITKWVFMGSITRTEFDLEFPASVPAGSKVFLCAFWYSPRAQSGPACEPVTAYIAGGVGAPVAAG